MGRKAREKQDKQSASRRLVGRLMAAFIVELRAILKRRAPAIYAAYPEARRPCHSCAFNPSTDGWTGMQSTCNTLMKCIRDDYPFYCHEGVPWKTPIAEWTPEQVRDYLEHRKVCGGYAVVVGDPATKLAFMRAALKVNGMDLAYASVPGAGELFERMSKKVEHEAGDVVS